MKLSDVEIFSAYSSYNGGSTLSDVSDEYDISPTTLSNYFKNKGLQVRSTGPSRKLSDEQIEQAHQLYVSGQADFNELSKKYGVSSGTVSRSVRLKYPDLETKNSLDETVFDSIETESQFYWVGFLAADGCVYDSPYGQMRLKLDLSGKDIQHLDQFRSFLQASHKIRKYSRTSFGETRPYCCFSVRSDHLCHKLTDLGIGTSKSASLKVNQKLALNRHFWRGFIDGDGTIGKNECQINLRSTSENIMQQYEKWVRSFCSTESKVICRDRSNPNWKPRCGLAVSSDYAVQILEKLYGDCDVALERKYQRAKKWFDKQIS